MCRLRNGILEKICQLPSNKFCCDCRAQGRNVLPIIFETWRSYNLCELRNGILGGNVNSRAKKILLRSWSSGWI